MIIIVAGTKVAQRLELFGFVWASALAIASRKEASLHHWRFGDTQVSYCLGSSFWPSALPFPSCGWSSFWSDTVSNLKVSQPKYRAFPKRLWPYGLNQIVLGMETDDVTPILGLVSGFNPKPPFDISLAESSLQKILWLSKGKCLGDLDLDHGHVIILLPESSEAFVRSRIEGVQIPILGRQVPGMNVRHTTWPFTCPASCIRQLFNPSFCSELDQGIKCVLWQGIRSPLPDRE